MPFLPDPYSEALPTQAKRKSKAKKHGTYVLLRFLMLGRETMELTYYYYCCIKLCQDDQNAGRSV